MTVEAAGDRKPTLEEVRTLLGAVRRLKDSHARELLDSVQRLLDQWSKRRPEVLLERRRSAPDYNVFRLLGLERYEVRLHSPFLADLLDPYGLHGQGGLFLRRFFEKLSEQDFLPADEEDAAVDPRPDFAGLAEKVDDIPAPGEWVVYQEQDRIDISIRSRKHGVLLFIENKIDAIEQDAQLTRYRDLLDRRRRAYGNRALIFLTPRGYGGAASGRPDIHLTYRDHIRPWIEGCLGQIEAEHARIILRQYLEIISRLSGGEQTDGL